MQALSLGGPGRIHHECKAASAKSNVFDPFDLNLTALSTRHPGLSKRHPGLDPGSIPLDW